MEEKLTRLAWLVDFYRELHILTHNDDIERYVTADPTPEIPEDAISLSAPGVTYLVSPSEISPRDAAESLSRTSALT